MVVCKYFLQGTCRYGNYCRYEHQIPANYGNDRPPSSSILRQPQVDFQGTPQQQPPNTSTFLDVNTLVKTVAQDMVGAEKGGQWLLSCYAPFKEKALFPGFEDWSPEEVRWGYYEARSANKLEAYKQQLQVMLREAMGKVRALQNPSGEVLKILKEIYNNSPASKNIFAQKAKNVFSTNTPKENNIFATAAQNAFSQNVFNPPQPPQNIFAQSQPPQNIFNPPQPPQNVFNPPQPPQNVFAPPQPSQNIFAPSQPPQKNVFPAPPSYSSSSVFGASQQCSDPHLYSKEEELSEEEKNWFLSDTLDIMRIPEKPPTYDMCFKG
ncbi:nucleoporin NUP42-like [Anthonomus grandis grandis]|uniref:nucleoporin NUP42-like n=1 Tax=Anthonomus grandis grandis TaxID=2921223 RepID=UPI0021662581|nr:nucleoporin NUP42-like [Anthonomus grandis grandis]